MQTPETTEAPATAGKYADRAVFTVNEFITDIFPMGRATFYQEVKAGRLKTVKRDKRRFVPVSERKDYPARLAAAQAAKQSEAA